LMAASPQGIFEIVRATPRHTADLRAIRLEALENHPTAFSADIERDRQTDWAARLQNTQGAIFIAYEGSHPAGMTGIQPGSSSKTRHSAFIWGVYVRPASRRKGIAKALLEAALEWGKGHGIVIVRLGVVSGNQAALDLYTRMGFQPYGNEPQALLVDGRSYDELLLAKKIIVPD
jgi:GNAT superfamily N-acetyltransferase